jgi:hypothetical protein
MEVARKFEKDICMNPGQVIFYILKKELSIRTPDTLNIQGILTWNSVING